MFPKWSLLLVFLLINAFLFHRRLIQHRKDRGAQLADWQPAHWQYAAQWNTFSWIGIWRWGSLTATLFLFGWFCLHHSIAILLFLPIVLFFLVENISLIVSFHDQGIVFEKQRFRWQDIEGWMIKKIGPFTYFMFQISPDQAVLLPLPRNDKKTIIRFIAKHAGGAKEHESFT